MYIYTDKEQHCKTKKENWERKTFCSFARILFFLYLVASVPTQNVN